MKELSRSEFIRRAFAKLGGGVNLIRPFAVLICLGLLLYYLGSFVFNIWNLADAGSDVEVIVSVDKEHCPNSGELSVVVFNASEKRLLRAELQAGAFLSGDEDDLARTYVNLEFRDALEPGESRSGCQIAPDAVDEALMEKFEWRILKKSYTFQEVTR